MPKVAEKILRMFREQPIQTPVGPIHASVSIGGVAFPSYVQTPAEAMTRAEAALREAKALGRDCHHFYLLTDDQRSNHRRDIVLGKQIKEAVKDDRLMLAYQPMVEATTGKIAHYECLLRMRAEDGSMVAAGEFIPAVERLGLSRLIDKRVLELGVEQLNEDPDVHLALNISGLTASDQSWLRRLIALVGGYPDIARRLTVEITETAAIQDIEESARFVATVRDLGCRVALDDFGAGYTSFRHLKALTVDIVKIDGSFVRDIATNRDNRLFVRTLVGMAKGFGLTTVAECVEDKESADILAAEGADYLQGFYYAKPELTRQWPQGTAIKPESKRTKQRGAEVSERPARVAARG
ncbi:MAG: EAL domain-containing protein [Inquilinus sp.]|nr:EAL domain-containing protein [Inquilinus sp.]